MFLFLSQWIKSICRRMTYHLLISTGAFILPIIFLLVSFTAFGLFVIDPEQAKILMNKFSIHQFIDLHKYRVVCAVLSSPNKRGISYCFVIFSPSSFINILPNFPLLVNFITDFTPCSYYFPPPRLLILQLLHSLLILGY